MQNARNRRGNDATYVKLIRRALEGSLLRANIHRNGGLLGRTLLPGSNPTVNLLWRSRDTRTFYIQIKPWSRLDRFDRALPRKPPAAPRAPRVAKRYTPRTHTMRMQTAATEDSPQSVCGSRRVQQSTLLSDHHCKLPRSGGRGTASSAQLVGRPVGSVA